MWRMVFRWFSFVLPMALACCARPSMPADLCQMSPHLRSWEGAEVRWHGSIVETNHHGYIFVSDHCARSIIVEMDERDARTFALRKTLQDNWTDTGLIVATVTGRLHRDKDVVRLRLSNIDGLMIRPMSKTDLDNWYRKNAAATLR